MTTPALLPLARADVIAWRQLVPPRAILPHAPQRMIWHWTGGQHAPNASHDLKSYTYLVAGPDGVLRRGQFSVADNCCQPLVSNRYAQHTGDFNGRSIGVSWCGMAGSNVGAGHFGRWPITPAQLHHGLAFSALLGLELGLDVSDPAQAFTHREAWELHGRKGRQNHVKPDWVVLPPVPGVTGWRACGQWMRAAAAGYTAQLRLLLADAPAPGDRPPPPAPPATPARIWARTTTALRRRPSPGTRQPALGTLPAGERVIVEEVAEGENVHGNRWWYRTSIGGWVWAGGTDLPAPPTH